MKITVKKVETNSGIRRILLVGVLATLLEPLAWGAGAPAPRPYVLKSSARPPASRLRVHDATEELDVQVDPAAVAANPETLTIDLPGTGLLEAVRSHFVVYRHDWK